MVCKYFETPATSNHRGSSRADQSFLHSTSHHLVTSVFSLRSFALATMAAPRLRPLVPHLLICTLLTLSTARAALTNLTIDDSDLSYFTWTEDTGSPAPTRPWAAISPATPCLYCSAQPQTADIQNQTWHDGSNNSAGSFAFQGACFPPLSPAFFARYLTIDRSIRT